MLFSMVVGKQANSARRFRFTRARIIAVAAASVLGVVLTAGVGVASSHRQVQLVVDGVERPLTTWNPSVDGVLASAGVQVQAADEVLVDARPVTSRSHTRVARGSRVEINSAIPVGITVAGKRQTVPSAAGSVHELLVDTSSGGSAVSLNRAQASKSKLPLTRAAAKVTIVDQAADGKETRETVVSASPIYDVEDLLETQGRPASPLDEIHIEHESAGEMVVAVTRVERQLERETSKIDFPKKTQPDPDMFVGESVETIKGVTGAEEEVQWVERRGGEERRGSLEKQGTAPVEEVKRVGEKEVTPQALIEAGLDPRATLVETTDAEGRVTVRYEAKLGTISSDAEIAALAGEDSDSRPGPVGTYSGADPRGVAQEMLGARGQSAEFSCLLSLWERESGWNPHAQNPSSGAYGIPQALPGSKMASAGADWQTNPRTQISWGLGYIEGRYGSPCGAWSFFQSNNWY